MRRRALVAMRKSTSEGRATLRLYERWTGQLRRLAGRRFRTLLLDFLPTSTAHGQRWKALLLEGYRLQRRCSIFGRTSAAKSENDVGYAEGLDEPIALPSRTGADPNPSPHSCADSPESSRRSSLTDTSSLSASDESWASQADTLESSNPDLDLVL